MPRGGSKLNPALARRVESYQSYSTPIPSLTLTFFFDQGLPPYEWWRDPPDEVKMRVYVFNVTNHEDFLVGKEEKINLQEIGPVVYLQASTMDFRELTPHTIQSSYTVRDIGNCHEDIQDIVPFGYDTFLLLKVKGQQPSDDNVNNADS
ncbi:hypothetical protein EVAR_14137_1 [Eumeta japonica]|uniref:Uncharacterized protein n=1 Tax=Eumeta variegata TaxID=151549 RepID=A0A4C1UFV9_EUMVA|nr:hypothetical protein EVAR_14137_1 [Eumeta japonica]